MGAQMIVCRGQTEWHGKNGRKGFWGFYPKVIIEELKDKLWVIRLTMCSFNLKVTINNRQFPLISSFYSVTPFVLFCYQITKLRCPSNCPSLSKLVQFSQHYLPGSSDQGYLSYLSLCQYAIVIKSSSYFILVKILNIKTSIEITGLNL